MFTVTELYRLSVPIPGGLWIFAALLVAAFLAACFFAREKKGAGK